MEENIEPKIPKEVMDTIREGMSKYLLCMRNAFISEVRKSNNKELRVDELLGNMHHAFINYQLNCIEMYNEDLLPLTRNFLIEQSKKRT